MMPAIARYVLLSWLFALAACTVQLVPSYDRELVQGLDQAHVEALAIFASVDGEEGSPATAFAALEQRYAAVIGRFEALRQRAQARPLPPLARRLSRLAIVRDFCNAQNDPTGCLNASPASLAEVQSLFRRMRRTHQRSGLAPDTVLLFRRSYDTAIEQALTVERTLQR